jgi:hypothetical protein
LFQKKPHANENGEITMATLTTVDGIQITFVTKAVAAPADHDANTGLAVTCVYGVAKEELRISESVEAFMKRPRITKNFSQLTRPKWLRGLDQWIGRRLNPCATSKRICGEC